MKHDLYCNGVPMIDCPRHRGLVKHDGWHFNGSPANKYAMGAYVHTTVLLQLGLVARTARVLGQHGIESAPLATEDTLTDYLKNRKRIFYELEASLVTNQNALRGTDGPCFVWSTRHVSKKLKT